MLSPKNFIDQFQIITQDDNPLVKLLYAMYINKFKINMEIEEYQIISELHQKIFSCTEEMREMNSDQIKEIFIYLDRILPCLADIIIMTWCLPRADQYNSKIIYNNMYQKNIQNYNQKLFDLVDLYVIRNFCMESLIKKNSIPIHCIDILWYWMCLIDVEVEFSFLHSGNGNFIILDKEDCVLFGVNMVSVFKLDVGKNVCKKGSFQKLLKEFITNETFIKYYSSVDPNYVSQRNKLIKH